MVVPDNFWLPLIRLYGQKNAQKLLNTMEYLLTDNQQNRTCFNNGNICKYQFDVLLALASFYSII